jgi:hypothetical protein
VANERASWVRRDPNATPQVDEDRTVPWLWVYKAIETFFDDREKKEKGVEKKEERKQAIKPKGNMQETHH